MADNGEWNGEFFCCSVNIWADLLNYFAESLFGCCGDCGTCLYGCCCPPCLFGSNAHKIDGSSCCLMCLFYCCLTEFYLCWIPHHMTRKTLRQKYGLRADPCGDCPTTCCCSPCALCQEARFLKNRGMTMGAAPHTMQPGSYNWTRQARLLGIRDYFDLDKHLCDILLFFLFSWFTCHFLNI
jgi:Cys-rich protein (TIGR01571 family)